MFSFLQISLKNAESQGNPKYPACSKGDYPGTPSLPSLPPAPARPREQEPSPNTWRAASAPHFHSKGSDSWLWITAILIWLLSKEKGGEKKKQKTTRRLQRGRGASGESFGTAQEGSRWKTRQGCFDPEHPQQSSWRIILLLEALSFLIGIPQFLQTPRILRSCDGTHHNLPSRIVVWPRCGSTGW